jgi:molybdenum cofactor cytidylyltransferase
MGAPKMLLPWAGGTILGTVLENVKASAVDGVLVVLGAGADDIEKAVRPSGFAVTRNPLFREGMLSSVRWGIGRLPPAAGAALIVLGDQPGVRAAVIDRVIEAWRAGSRGLVLPVHRGQGGHPLLVDLRYREEIGRLSPDVGLREILARHPEDVLRVEAEDPAVLEDIDTPADLDRGPRS